MRITARADYAIRAVVELAAQSQTCTGPVKAEALATAQDIPLRFLLTILNELRRAGLVDSRRGVEGGYRLAKPAFAITLADILRAIDGPLANVAGTRPDRLELHGTAAPLREVWVAMRSSLRAVLEHVTVADVVTGELPAPVRELARTPDAWVQR